MSMNLLRTIQGETDGEFKRFLDGFEASGGSPRIAWYPSADKDFSPIERLTSASPVDAKDGDAGVVEPDLFLFTDYLMGSRPFFLTGSEHRDQGGKVLYSWTRPEELSRLDCRLDSKIVQFADRSNYIGRTFFLQVKTGDRNQPGEYRPVLYVVTENEYFCDRYLVGMETRISQIIHVRYGGGCGGGGHSPGSWLINVLKPLVSEVFITDADPKFDDRDNSVVAIYPRLGPIQGIPEMEMAARIPG